MMNRMKIVRPDSKGRITLGHLADGVSSYAIIPAEEGRLILEPHVNVPAREMWLYKNKIALAQVKQGMKELAEGKLVDLGDFTKYVDDEDENYSASSKVD